MRKSLSLLILAVCSSPLIATEVHLNPDSNLNVEWLSFGELVDAVEVDLEGAFEVVEVNGQFFIANGSITSFPKSLAGTLGPLGIGGNTIDPSNPADALNILGVVDSSGSLVPQPPLEDVFVNDFSGPQITETDGELWVTQEVDLTFQLATSPGPIVLNVTGTIEAHSAPAVPEPNSSIPMVTFLSVVGIAGCCRRFLLV